MLFSSFFFFNDTATTEIYTLSLHDALPISMRSPSAPGSGIASPLRKTTIVRAASAPQSSSRMGSPSRRSQAMPRSEEHTSELQSRQYLVCRLLLEKKKRKTQHN